LKQLVILLRLIQYLGHPKGVFEGVGHTEEPLGEWIGRNRATAIGKGFGEPFLRRVELTAPRQHFYLDRLDAALLQMLIQLAAMPGDILGRSLGITLREGKRETRECLIHRSSAG
jgi:hypothetical protein